MIRKFNFTSGQKSAIFRNARAKSRAEPENSTNLSVANSTPNRAFFVRSFRTPQRTPEALRGSERHSMVACGGKGFALCCIPLIAVSQPVTRYRPNPEKFSGNPDLISVEIAVMLFKFLTGSRLKITIRANSEQEARQRLQLSESAICIARYSNAFLAQKQAKLTACEGVIYA